MILSSFDLNNTMYLGDKDIPDIIHLTSGQVIDGSHYQCCFFENYWSSFTNISTVNLNLVFQGKIKLSLYRRDFKKKTTSLILEEEIHHSTSKKYSITLQLEKNTPTRIFFKIEAQENCSFQNNSSWSSELSPQRNIRLAIITCTFNKEEYILKNLERLKPYIHHNESLELFIIDNASNLNLISEERIHYIPQGNFGGAGGFTRGLIEALKNNSITHFLFMDDDIDLDPNSILRAKAWLSYQTKDLPLAGPMLNIKKRNSIWEQGALFSSPEHILTPKPVTFDLDLDSEENLDSLNKVQDIDYGGWWFFCFSRIHVAKSGLPIPFFIRGDDKEYGLRLKKNGYSTLAIPGIGVWHEPFTTKTSAWLNYYDLRNTIFIHLLYNYDRSTLLKIYKDICKYFISDILIFKYNKANTILFALKKLLEGPQVLKRESNPQGHKEIFQHLNPYHNEKEYEKYMTFPEPKKSLLATLIKMVTLNGHLIPSFLLNKVSQFENYKHFKTDVLTSGPLIPSRAIEYYDQDHEKVFKFMASKKIFFSQLLSFIFILIELTIKLPKLRKEWRKEYPEITGEKFWLQHLKIDS